MLESRHRNYKGSSPLNLLPIKRPPCREAFLLVRTTGLEPAPNCFDQPLKLACLPIPPCSHTRSFKNKDRKF